MGTSDPSSRTSFLSELKRRRVFRVLAVYAAAAFAVVEISNNFLPALHVPSWVNTVIAGLAVVGFPVVLGFAWAFDITPEGVRRDDRRPGDAPGSRRRRLAVAASLAAVTAVGLFGVVWLSRSGRGSADLRRTVAVLPFTSLSDDPQDEYFSDGMTDDILTQLYKVGTLRVISHTSAMQYKGTRKPVRQIARELRAGAVLEGSVRRVSDSVRINAQLIDGRTDQHLWANTYDREIKNVLAVQSEIARSVAAALDASLSTAEEQRLTRVGGVTVDPIGYEEYLRGLYYMGDGRNMLAATSFQKAVAVDPSFAPAYAALAENAFRLAFMGMTPPRTAFEAVRENASRALALDPDIGEAHAALGLYYMHYRWDWIRAEQHLRRAIELSPASATVRHDYAHLLMVLGRFEESADETARAAAADPFNAMLIACAGWHRLPQGQVAVAEAAARRALEVNPTIVWAQMVRGWAAEYRGDGEEAVAAFQGALKDGGENLALGALGHSYAVAGRQREAREVLQKLTQARAGTAAAATASMDAPEPAPMGAAGTGSPAMGEPDGMQAVTGQTSIPAMEQPGAMPATSETMGATYASAYDIAGIYAGLGDTDAALDWLGRAADERSVFFVHLAWDPRFDALHGEPAYAGLIERLGLPARTENDSRAPRRAAAAARPQRTDTTCTPTTSVQSVSSCGPSRSRTSGSSAYAATLKDRHSGTWKFTPRPASTTVPARRSGSAVGTTAGFTLGAGSDPSMSSTRVASSRTDPETPRPTVRAHQPVAE